MLAVLAVAGTAAEQASAQVADGLELGLQSFAYDYEETFDGGSVTDAGRMTGFTAAYGRPVGGFSFDVRLRYAQGQIDYRSSDGERLDDVTQAVG